MCGLMPSDGFASSSVWPSAAARATHSAPTLPPAPERFSTTTVRPRSACMRGWMMRATMSISPPGGYGTTMVSERLGNACAPAAPLATSSAMKHTNLLIASSSCLFLRYLLTGERRLAFLHEGSAAFFVILTVEAFLDQAVALRRVELRLHHFADDALRRAHRERCVRCDRFAVLARQLLELGCRHHAVHQAHLFRLGGAELARGDHDLLRVGRADDVDQLLHRRGAIAQPELCRRDREARIVGRETQVAGAGDAEAPADAVAADHGEGRLVEVLQRGLRGVADLLVAPHGLGGGALGFELRDIGAGDERLVARAGEHHHADRGIGAEVREHARDRLPHADRHGVPARGIVEHEPADRAVLARVDPRFAFRLDGQITLRSRMPRMSPSE